MKLTPRVSHGSQQEFIVRKESWVLGNLTVADDGTTKLANPAHQAEVWLKSEILKQEVALDDIEVPGTTWLG